MKNNKKRDDKSSILVPINRSLIKYAAIILIMIAFVYMIVADPQKITLAMSTTVAVLSPFLIGLCLAYVVNLLLRPVERVWCCAFRKSKQTKLVLKSKRPVCLVFSYIVMLGLIFAIVFMIIPALRDALVSFYAKLPQYAKTIEQWYGAMVDFLTSHGIEITKKTITAAEISDLLNKAIKSYCSAVEKT